MKFTFLIFLPLSFLSFSSNAQDVFSIDTVLWVEDSASAEELYSRAKVWLAETFVDANSVIELDDPENHQIFGSGKGLDVVFTTLKHQALSGPYTFDIKLYFKEGRFKIELTNFRHQSYDGKYNLGLLYTAGHLDGFYHQKEGKFYVAQREPTDSKSIETVTEKSKRLFLSAQETLSKPLTPQNDDW